MLAWIQFSIYLIYNFHLDQNGSPSVGVSNVDIAGIVYL